MDWSLIELLYRDSLGVHWSVHLLAVGLFVGLVVALLKTWLRGSRLARMVLGAPPDEPEPPAGPPEPDPRTERLEAARLPPARGVEVTQSTHADMGAILGPGTPLMGPAPPSIRYEQDENVERVEEAPVFEPGFRDPLMGEE